MDITPLKGVRYGLHYLLKDQADGEDIPARLDITPLKGLRYRTPSCPPPAPPKKTSWFSVYNPSVSRLITGNQVVIRYFFHFLLTIFCAILLWDPLEKSIVTSLSKVLFQIFPNPNIKVFLNLSFCPSFRGSRNDKDALKVEVFSQLGTNSRLVFTGDRPT